MTPNQFFYAVVNAHNTLPHGQRPTAEHVEVARRISRWQNATPSHAKLAKVTSLCLKTIGNALKRLRKLGLLGWEKQFIRLPCGRRAQTVNRYFFLPSKSSGAASRPQPASPKSKKEYDFSSPGKFAHRNSPPDRATALPALEAIRTAMERRLAAAWMKARGASHGHHA